MTSIKSARPSWIAARSSGKIADMAGARATLGGGERSRAPWAMLALSLGAVLGGGCGSDGGSGAIDARIDAPRDAAIDAAIDADPDGPAAFRLVDLDLRDPHVYAAFQGCRDITDESLMQFAVNGTLQAHLGGDADGDGALDESIVLVFRPLAPGAATSPLELHRPRCTAPAATTACAREPAAAPPIVTVAGNLPGVTCLGPLPGTVRPYMPSVASTLPPCFRSDPIAITLDVAGLQVPLRDARFAGTYFGDQGINNGLLMGFVTVADARATILPATLPLVGGQSLESVLPGGNGTCTGFSDEDLRDGVQGWWFYFNFMATRVPWSD